ncbi:MAG: nucleotide exchange factor GrpE [Muribaculaceae bacterium]|nr:nucleotide exchange factor GrpE [Muribaculaceae bacterium]MBR5685475.1 nucleotide exchange factor GrpE [Muribaculaceae bacterium]
MSKKNKKNQNDEAQVTSQEEVQDKESLNTEQQAQDTPETDDPEKKIAELEEAVENEKKEYLFLMADFENFRKRTLKEKAELIKNGAESAMRDLLPVVDDLERALEAINKGGDLDSLKEGVGLIYNKFVKYLESQHVTAIDSTGKDFDTDVHEAVTMFPAPDPSMKGKVIDTTIKGYMINDKVLRHAKVVVGS